MGCPPDSDDAVAICARLGSSDAPVDAGWFIHHIRSTPNGAEMRSRFWMGGPHIAVRNAPGVASQAVRPIASRVLGTSEATARNLLVHCAQEMNHLAGFLPELYEAFGDEASEIQQQLRENPKLLTAFIEETLRYEPPFRGHCTESIAALGISRIGGVCQAGGVDGYGGPTTTKASTAVACTKPSTSTRHS